MSDLSSKTTPPVVTEVEKKVRPVVIWATAGGLLLALQIYVWTRWVTGPYFVRVPQGPSDPPMYMKTMLTINAAAMVILLPLTVYWFLIRPWVRERRFTLDGLLFVSCALFFFQDPFLNYVNTWCTYNAWLWNRGSWSSHVPGWVSPEEPGRQVAEPLLINATGYGMVMFFAIAGCWLMRRMKNRWPGMSNLKLMLATYAAALTAGVRATITTVGAYASMLSPLMKINNTAGTTNARVVLVDTYALDFNLTTPR